MSRQIKALEDHLGVALFRRMNRALLLTDAGQLLYRTATDVLKQLEDTASRLMAQRSDNLVTVTTTVSFASLWLVPRLQNFRASIRKLMCASPPTTTSSICSGNA